MGVTVHRQRYDYTTAQFVSEIGGAAGLVLGASVISIVKILDDFITNIKVEIGLLYTIIYISIVSDSYESYVSVPELEINPIHPQNLYLNCPIRVRPKLLV